MRYSSKFHQNPLNDGRDIVILRFFEMVAARQFGCVERIIAPHTKYSWWSLLVVQKLLGLKTLIHAQNWGFGDFYQKIVAKLCRVGL